MQANWLAPKYYNIVKSRPFCTKFGRAVLIDCTDNPPGWTDSWGAALQSSTSPGCEAARMRMPASCPSPCSPCCRWRPEPAGHRCRPWSFRWGCTLPAASGWPCPCRPGSLRWCWGLWSAGPSSRCRHGAPGWRGPFWTLWRVGHPAGK